MLAKFLTSLCLVALAAGIDDEPFPILETMGIHPTEYTTVSSKLSSADIVLFHGRHLDMSECHVQLNSSYLCGNGVLKGIEVKVSDPFDFAMVDLNKKDGKVFISRNRISPTSASCPGTAQVDIRLSCDYWKISDSHHRIPLPPIPDASG